MSKFDLLYRRIVLTKFFTKGWGNPDNLRTIFEFRKTLSDREKCQRLVPDDYPIVIDKEIEQKDCRILEGHFMSPLEHHLPNLIPEEVKTAKFQIVLPPKWKGPLKPMMLHLAGTGDHGFGRRRTFLARPLVKEFGIGSILLENPFYGVRKPKSQLRSSLHNVSDLFVMGGALVLESLALFHWCERNGYGPLGITGISMGGFMASLAATNWHKPLSLIPCLSWSTASAVFTQGVMSGSIPWKMLQKQYQGDSVYQDDLTKHLVSPEKLMRSDAFHLGQEFAKHYPSSMADMMAYQRLHSQSLSQAAGTTTTNPSGEIHCSNEAQSKVAPHAAVPGEASPATGSGKTVDKSNRGHNPSNVQNVRHKSSQTNPPAADTNSKEPGKEKLATKSVHERSSYLSFAQWKNTFKGVRSYVSWLEYLRLPTRAKPTPSSSSSPDLTGEALDFMRGVMDECTHLGNFCTPLDTSLIIIVAAKHDAYVPRDKTLNLQELWPGSEVRYVDTGHIGAFLTKQHVFRKAIKDSLDRQTEKYHS